MFRRLLQQKGAAALLQQRSSYVLLEPVAASLNARYGGTWRRIRCSRVDSHAKPLLMNDFRPGIGCCTITALTAVFNQLQQTTSFPSIPTDLPTLFNQIELVASRHGYRPDRGRTNPLRIGAIVRDLLQRYSLRGKAGSSMFLSTRKIMQEIDAGRPLLLNIAFGVYRRHTVVITGYECWQSENQVEKLRRWIWLVHDGWSKDVQRIDHQALSSPFSGAWSIFSVTRIVPDSDFTSLF